MIKKFAISTIVLGTALLIGLYPAYSHEIKVIDHYTAEAEQEAVVAYEVVEVENEPIYLGKFLVTAYCGCERCCGIYAKNRPIDANGKVIVNSYTGERCIQGKTIAVDPKIIPLGSVIIIDGKEYRAIDVGGAIKGNHIDMYFENHQDALDWGKKYKDIYFKGDI